MKITAGELAALVQGTLEGDPSIIITHPSKIEEAGDGSLCYLDNLQYEPFLYQTKAAAVIVNNSFQAKSPVQPAIIRVENVRLTVSELFKKFQEFPQSSGIDQKANIHESAIIGEAVSVGAFSTVFDSVQIGSGTFIYPQVYIGKNVQIGENVVIYPGVRIYKDCVIGNRCIIHANAVIGSDGFGFAPDESGQYQKIAQLGNVVLGNDVEIGSNTTIDRGTMGSTKIGDGCKLDNLIQIAHNVQIGNHTVIAAQAGIAGSAKIGSYCMIGGQVGIAGHITIADRTMIQAQSGIASSLEQSNSKWYGSPAMEYFAFLRSFAEFKKLPALAKKLKELEDKLKAES